MEGPGGAIDGNGEDVGGGAKPRRGEPATEPFSDGGDQEEKHEVGEQNRD